MSEIEQLTKKEKVEYSPSNAKLQGGSCKEYTVDNVICILDSPTDVQTTLSCPLLNWEWTVSRDSNTGSIYWTDNNNCQGVWNVIDLTAGSVVYVSSQILTIIGMIYLVL